MYSPTMLCFIIFAKKKFINVYTFFYKIIILLIVLKTGKLYPLDTLWYFESIKEGKLLRCNIIIEFITRITRNFFMPQIIYIPSLWQ